MLYLLLAIIALRLLYWYLLFIRLALHKEPNETGDPKSISLVVAVKNNLQGIKTLVAKIQKQNYRQWEMVIASDGPDPALQSYITGLNTDHIRYVEHAEGNGKKYALPMGIEAARHPWIAVTDADCVPSSLRYFEAIAAPLTQPEYRLVLGFAPLRAGGSLVSHLASYEAVYVGMQYLSYAKAGIPYMGVGRNMLFDKTLYWEHCDQVKQSATLSGDDDLFVQAAANRHNTTICIHPYSFCISDAPTHLGEWVRQRTRQIGTAPQYKWQHRWLLAIFALLHLGVYALMVVLWLTGGLSWQEVLACWAIMVGLMTVVQYPVFRKLRAVSSLLFTPLADPFLAGFYFIIAIRFKINPSHPWK